MAKSTTPSNKAQIQKLRMMSMSRSWLQSSNNKMATVILLLSIVSILSILGNVTQFVLRPAPVYFAQTPDLRITKLISLDQPYISQQGLLDWASESVVVTLSMDFAHWREDLMKSRINYSSKAFNEVFTSLKDSGIMEAITERRLVSSAVKQAAPVITGEGVVNGKKTWKIEFPIIMSFEGSSGVEFTQEFDVSLIVTRSSTLKHPKGVIIKQMLLKKRG